MQVSACSECMLAVNVLVRGGVTCVDAGRVTGTGREVAVFEALGASVFSCRPTGPSKYDCVAVCWMHAQP